MPRPGGYDAVCIDTMSASGVGALRSMLSIPVIGPGRASMLMTLTRGERFSILIMREGQRHLYLKNIADLDFRFRCASVRSRDMVPDSINLLKGKEEQVFPLLQQAALRCVKEDGADVILLGSTTMHEAHAWLALRLPVPIINPGPLTNKLAEAALELRHTHSRKADSAPLVPKPAMIDAMLAAAQGQQREA